MINNKDSEFKGIFILLLGGLLYSLYGVFSRVIGDNIAPFFQYWTRALIIILLLFVLIIINKVSLKSIKKNLPWVCLTGITSGLLVPLYFLAINKLPIGTTLFLFYATSTITSYILGYFLHHEKMTRVKMISLLLAIVGLFVVSMDTFRLQSTVYIVYAIISGALFGVNVNMVKKLGKEYPSFQVNLFNWTGVFVIGLISSYIFKESGNWNILSIPWAANIGLAVCSLCASLSVIIGFKYIEVQKGSIILLSELVFGVILGIALYAEIPTVFAIIGNILILGSLIIPNLNINKLLKD
jgi:drug/metabolite transporter (DMT)-like permease